MTALTPRQGLLKADLEQLYRAGRVVYPDNAAWVSLRGRTLLDDIDVLNGQSARMSDHQPMPDCVEMATEVYQALTGLTRTLNDIAAGLVAVADDLVARDSDAQLAFRELRDTLPDAPSHPEPRLPPADAPESEGGLGEDPADTGADGVQPPQNEGDVLIPDPEEERLASS